MKIHCVPTIHTAFVTLVNKALWLQAVYKVKPLSSLSRRAATGGGAAQSKLAEHTSSFEGVFEIWPSSAHGERITPH